MYADLSDKRNKQAEGKDIRSRPVRANKSQLSTKFQMEAKKFN